MTRRDHRDEGTSLPPGDRAGEKAPAEEGATPPKRPGGPSLAQSLRPRGPVQLDTSHYDHADATVIAVAGELDILTAARFSAYVDEVPRRRAGDVIVDLTEAGFVDSVGLQILLSIQRRVVRRGRRWALICPGGAVRRAIELARLTDVLDVVASLEEYERRRAGG